MPRSFQSRANGILQEALWKLDPYYTNINKEWILNWIPYLKSRCYFVEIYNFNLESTKVNRISSSKNIKCEKVKLNSKKVLLRNLKSLIE